MRGFGVVLTNFMTAILCSSATIMLIEKAISSRGLKLTNITKYIITSMTIIISGVICGKIIAFIN